MKKLCVLLALVVCLLWTTIPASAEAAQEVMAARLERGFTVWRLWLCSDYQQVYDWPNFVREILLLNNWRYDRLDSLPVGTVIVLPKANTEYVAIDADRCRLSPLPADVAPVPPPLLPATPEPVAVVPPPFEEVAEPPLLTAVATDEIATLGLELAETKNNLSQELAENRKALGEEVNEAELRLMASLDEFKEGVGSDLRELAGQLTALRQQAGGDLETAEAKRLLSPLEARLDDLQNEVSQVRQAIEGLNGVAIVSAEKDEAGLSWPLVIALLLGLALIILAIGFWLKRRQDEKEKETEKALAVAAARSEVNRKRLSLAQSYGWQIANFRLPEDLRTAESPESVPLIEVTNGNGGKKSGRIRPKVLAPCFMDKDTDPIYLDNLPNHMRHCATCREKLSLRSASEPEPAPV